jgi:excisionase family DNA binding protein
MASELLTTGEAAKLCGVTPDAVLKWIKKGKLPASRTAGGHYRVERSTLTSLGLGQVAEDRSAGPATAGDTMSPMRCWEYFSRQGEPREACRSCLVYVARAQNCFALAELAEQRGHRRQFCQTECVDCPFYRAGHGMATTALVITRDEALTRRLTSGIDPEKVVLQLARSGYESASSIGTFRPAVIVMDSDLAEVRDGSLPAAVAADERTRGTRVFVALREGHEVALDAAAAATIAAPFTARKLEHLVERLPFAVDSAPEDVA